MTTKVERQLKKLLTKEELIEFDSLTPEMQKKYLATLTSGKKISPTDYVVTTFQPVHYEKEESESAVSTIQNIVDSSMITTEAGSNISVYLSADALKILKKYMKKHKIKNRSKLIESLVTTVLKEPDK